MSAGDAVKIGKKGEQLPSRLQAMKKNIDTMACVHSASNISFHLSILLDVPFNEEYTTASEL